MTMTYHVTENVGKCRYVVSFHDGIKIHKDNSPFFDVRTFGNKRKLQKFESELKSSGYVKQ